MNYIGIDNGLDGAIAIINQAGLHLHVMPTVSDGKKRHVDPVTVSMILEVFTPCFVMFERPAGSKSANAAKSMQESFAYVDAVLQLQQVPNQKITARTWQDTFWTWRKGIDTKQAALKVARGLWPDKDWRKNKRCRGPHDGLVDSALIAEYCKRVKGM